jgi:hypothetical protein
VSSADGHHKLVAKHTSKRQTTSDNKAIENEK